MDDTYEAFRVISSVACGVMMTAACLKPNASKDEHNVAYGVGIATVIAVYGFFPVVLKITAFLVVGAVLLKFGPTASSWFRETSEGIRQEQAAWQGRGLPVPDTDILKALEDGLPHDVIIEQLKRNQSLTKRNG